MKLETKDQWRRAVIERRVEQMRDGSSFLDEIVERLMALRGIEDWMVPALIDAAIEEWEAQVRGFVDQCNYAELQARRRARAQAEVDSEIF